VTISGYRGVVIGWLHAFIDVGPESVGPAREFWSSVAGWPVSAPWDEHPEFHSLMPPSPNATSIGPKPSSPRRR